MTRQEDARQLAELEQANAKLEQSLEHCRELLSECRSKLAANFDERFAAMDGTGKARHRPAETAVDGAFRGQLMAVRAFQHCEHRRRD